MKTLTVLATATFILTIRRKPACLTSPDLAGSNATKRSHKVRPNNSGPIFTIPISD
ncbi:MAG: hypothetical protein H8E91_05130 [Planctomycetes bacterium]|nr:hypothetical protein [Planctomycetota bacterium]